MSEKAIDGQIVISCLRLSEPKLLGISPKWQTNIMSFPFLLLE